jgi:Lrp/AsnC family transcriptional regulator for asnA, asnC and gidA
MEFPDLDKTDIEILAHLQKDGRKSFTDISEEIKVSVGTIRNRYNKLLENNVFHIIGWIDPTMVGYNAYSRVNIVIRPTSKINQVAEELIKLPEASFVAFTSGEFDLEANIICKNNRDLIHLMDTVIHKLDGVYETNTTVYLKVLKWASHNVTGPVDSKK